MGDVENGSVLGLPLTKRSRVRNVQYLYCVVLSITPQTSGLINSAQVRYQIGTCYFPEIYLALKADISVFIWPPFLNIYLSLVHTLSYERQDVAYCP